MKLHHIGRVVENLQSAVDYYREYFGLEPVSDPVVDPIQRVEVVFLDTGNKSGPTIELICPQGDDSPVSRFLERGGGLHHLCFEVDSVSGAIERLQEKGAKVLGGIVPGKGHGGRRTAWLFTGEKELVELVEVSGT